MKRCHVTSSAPVSCGPFGGMRGVDAGGARAARAAATRSVGEPAVGALDQVGEHRVVEAAPPIGGDRRDRDGRIGTERRRRASVAERSIPRGLAQPASAMHDHRRQRDDRRRHRPRHRARGAPGRSSQAIHSPVLVSAASPLATIRLSMSFNCDPFRLREAREVLVEHLREHDRHLLGRDLAFRRELDANDAAVVGRASRRQKPLASSRSSRRVIAPGSLCSLARQLGDRRGAAAAAA